MLAEECLCLRWAEACSQLAMDLGVSIGRCLRPSLMTSLDSWIRRQQIRLSRSLTSLPGYPSLDRPS